MSEKKNNIQKEKKSDVKKDRAVDKRNLSLRNFSVIATIMFIAIVLVFNIVFDNLLGDKLKWDWTGNKMYSIGDVTEEILANLDKNIEIIGLFEQDSQYYNYYADIMPMLDEYVSKSSGRISLTFVDPDLDPTILQKIDPDNVVKPSAGNFVVFSEDTGKAKNLISSELYQVEMNQYYETVVTGIIAEQSITGAIRYVASETTPVIYFTSGHGELDYTNQYQTMVSLLQNNNYKVLPLDIFDINEIPEDCAALIMVDPQNDITAGGRQVIFDWLRSGGSLMVLSSFNQADFSELNTLLEEFNIEISNSRLREEDIENQYQQDAYSIRANAPAGAVTATAIDRYTLSLNTRAINEIKNARDWLTVEPVLTTSDKGVAEVGGDAESSSAQSLQYIGLLAEYNGWVNQDTVTDPARVIVYGSSALFRDDIIQAFGTNLYNPTLFYNSINWLAGENQDETLLISPKVPTSYAIAKGTTTSIIITAVFVMLIIPISLLIVALVVYRKRKHL